MIVLTPPKSEDYEFLHHLAWPCIARKREDAVFQIDDN
jgi:hypothetical protein